MSRLSIDAPPDTGKTSRKESVARSGRSRTSSVDTQQPQPVIAISPRGAGPSGAISPRGLPTHPNVGKGTMNTNHLFVIQDDQPHDLSRDRVMSGVSDASDFDPLNSLGLGLTPYGTRGMRSQSAYVGPAAPFPNAHDPFGHPISPNGAQPSPTKLPYAEKAQRIQDALHPTTDPFGSSAPADPFASPFPAAQTTTQPTSTQAPYNPFDVFDSSFGSQPTKAAPSTTISIGISSIPTTSSGPKSPKSPKSPKNKKKEKEGKKKKKKGESSDEESEEESDEESDDSDDDGKAEDMKKVKPFPPSSPPPGPPGGAPGGASLHPPGFDPSARRHSAPTPPTMKVDVLAYMKKGTPFLKYGKHGYPHFRQFQLSDDNSKIMWFSQGKKLKDTQIDLSDVDELRLGQTTPIFARHKAPELAKSSFSVIYHNGKKSLDLIAKDPNEFRIWSEGLSQLLKKSKMGDYHTVENLKNLVIDVPVVTGRRSSIEILDAFTGKNADQQLGEDFDKQPTRERAPSTGNKQMYKEVAKSFTALKKKLAKRKEELRESRYYMAPAYESMQVIVKRVDESIIKCNDWFQDGEYGLCDDEIWRAGVDLESLKNMMAAIKA